MTALRYIRGATRRLAHIRWMRALAWPACVAAWLTGASAALVPLAWALAHLVPLPERLGHADSVVVTYQGGKMAHALLAEDDRWRFPTGLRDVDPAYVDALLALEDRRFYWHPGIDPIALARATTGNLRAGEVESGASTITMQVARLLEPRPRTFGAKAIEALRAIQLEIRMSKDEILETYLRFAPYGGNIEGIEAAAQSFWGRGPSSLSAPEIATLLAIPQSPTARRPAPENELALRDARDRIAHKLASRGALPGSERPEELARAFADSEVPTATSGPPRDIPHVARWLERHRPEALARDERGRGQAAVRIQTTLEPRIQRRMARAAQDHAARLRASGAPHVAAIAVDKSTGRVRGMVGNLDFDPATPGSALPAFAAPRSTGSLLKPVAYAAALDEGLVAPSHALIDAPLARGDYRPQNFDRRYRGLVGAEEALASSLNIPFVRLVERLGVDEFVQTMVRFGLHGPAYRAGDGGLELVVGGMPASALEVASLYAGIAREGRPITPTIYRGDGAEATAAPLALDSAALAVGGLPIRGPLEPALRGAHAPGSAERGEPGTGDDESRARAISRAASWLTIRALTRRSHPRADLGGRRAREQGIAWKTGTSYAYHDAWTAGFGDQYVVVVWAGDLAFQRHPELIGANVAAPLFFDIVRAIDQKTPVRSAKPTDELAEIEICPRSGRRPGPHCPHTATVDVPARTAAPARCELHEEITVDADSGHRIPEGCRPPSLSETETRVVFRPPKPLARYERSRGRRAGNVPRPHPDCPSERETSLAITAPPANATIVLDSNRPARDQPVRLEAYSSAGGDVHWYVSGAYHASSAHDEAVFWTPEPGSWTISAVGEHGTRHVRELAVEGEAASEAQSKAQAPVAPTRASR